MMCLNSFLVRLIVKDQQQAGGESKNRISR